MKFYYAPNSCAIGIHLLLEELGISYAAHRISLADREQLTPEFRAVNPKGKIPALVRNDGSLLTEFQAIAIWLARTHPDTGLWPHDFEQQTRLIELLDFIVGSLHMRGFTFITVAAKFSASPEAQADLQAHGRAQAEIGFGYLAGVLDDKPYLMGDFGLADAALFYLTQWALRADVPMPPSTAAHNDRMLSRPAVRAALEAEGMAPLRAN